MAPLSFAPAAVRVPWPTTLAFRLATLCWALLLAVPLLAGLGSYPLFDVDEGAFSAATRELLASGDWGRTTLNGAPRFDKPILVYWLQAASVAALGLNEWALRLPSALCTWAAALAGAHFAAQRRGAAAGALTGVLLVTALGPWAMARAATADALLNLCLMLTALDLWRHLASGARTPLRRAACWAALGLLAKGPIALLVPGGALLLWAASRRDAAALRRTLGDPLAWALLVGLAAPWYVVALQRDGMAFVNGFLLKHNLGRFAGPMEGHGGSLLYYGLVLPLLWLPWTPLWAVMLRRWRALWADAGLRFGLCWAGFVVVFFSLSGTKLPHYSLYAAPGLLMLSGWALTQTPPGHALRSALWAALALLAAALAALPWALQSGALPVHDAFYAGLLHGAPLPRAPLAAGAVLLGLIALLAGAPLAVLRRRPFAWRFAAAAWLAATAHGLWLAPWLGEALQGPIRRTALAAAPLAKGGTVVQWEVHWPSAGVYLQRAVPARAPAPGELAITRLDRLPPGVPVRVLRRENGVALVRREVR